MKDHWENKHLRREATVKCMGPTPAAELAPQQPSAQPKRRSHRQRHPTDRANQWWRTVSLLDVTRAPAMKRFDAAGSFLHGFSMLEKNRDCIWVRI